MRHQFLAFLSLSLATAATLVAQQGAERSSTSPGSAQWFGVRLPAGLGDPHKPVLDVSKATPAPAVVPPGEEGNRELTGAAVRKHLEAIVGIARADRGRGEKAWGRITGFRAADETHAWVLEQFKAAGLRDSETQTYTATQATWYPKSRRRRPAPQAATSCWNRHSRRADRS